MKAHGDLQELEQGRDRESAILRARMATLMDTLKHDAWPARWVREHPYMATAGAATIGFAAGQFGLEPFIAASRAAFGAAAPAAVSPRPVSSPAAPPAPPASRWAEILSIIVALAPQFLKQQQTCVRPASLEVANAGSVLESAFPGPFPPPAEECPVNSLDQSI